MLSTSDMQNASKQTQSICVCICKYVDNNSSTSSSISSEVISFTFVFIIFCDVSIIYKVNSNLIAGQNIKSFAP